MMIKNAATNNVENDDTSSEADTDEDTNAEQIKEEGK